MRLCKGCSYPARPYNAACARCGRPWPYFTSGGASTEVGFALPLARGKHCPRCGRLTSRRPTPLLLKPLRWVAGDRSSYRRCTTCRWGGMAFHAAPPPGGRSSAGA
jgi:hypothetical protein